MTDTVKRDFVHGWKTHLDGTREQLTEDDAANLWAAVKQSRDKQAELMPTTYDALRAFIDADERLSDLKWRKYIFDLADGEGVALIERGSTGVFRAVWQKPYLYYQGCVGKMGDGWIKRLAGLTDDERTRMDQCEERHREFMVHETANMQRMQAFMGAASDENEVTK